MPNYASAIVTTREIVEALSTDSLAVFDPARCGPGVHADLSPLPGNEVAEKGIRTDATTG